MKKSPNPRQKTRKTGDELLKERESDPVHKAQMRELERQRVAAADEYTEAAGPLMTELASAGYEIQRLDLLGQSSAYKDAIPILIRWLPEIANLRVKHSIVHVLSKSWAGYDVVTPLLAEFRVTPDCANAGLKWAIGNALEAHANDAIFDDVVELVQEKRHGVARQMLVVALGKMKNPKAVDVLIGLLGDDEMVGSALIGLKKLRADKARPPIERLLNHPRPRVRKQAMQALAKIDS